MNKFLKNKKGVSIILGAVIILAMIVVILSIIFVFRVNQMQIEEIREELRTKQQISFKGEYLVVTDFDPAANQLELTNIGSTTTTITYYKIDGTYYSISPQTIDPGDSITLNGIPTTWSFFEVGTDLGNTFVKTPPKAIISDYRQIGWRSSPDGWDFFFDGSQSNVIGGTILKWEWKRSTSTFDPDSNGITNAEFDGTGDSMGTGKKITYFFQDSDTGNKYYIALRVTDNAGMTDIVQIYVDVSGFTSGGSTYTYTQPISVGGPGYGSPYGNVSGANPKSKGFEFYAQNNTGNTLRLTGFRIFWSQKAGVAQDPDPCRLDLALGTWDPDTQTFTLDTVIMPDSSFYENDCGAGNDGTVEFDNSVYNTISGKYFDLYDDNYIDYDNGSTAAVLPSYFELPPYTSENKKVALFRVKAGKSVQNIPGNLFLFLFYYDEDNNNIWDGYYALWVPVLQNLNDFDIEVTPIERTVSANGSTTYDVTVSSKGEFSDPVTLSVTGLPADASYSFSQNPVTPPAGGSVTVTLTITAGTTTGTFTLNVIGTYETLSHTFAVTLTIV